MKISCSPVQEELAWGRSLNVDQKSHVMECEDCHRVALEITALDQVMSSQFEVEVPDHFADRVMLKIKEYEKASAFNSLFQRFLDSRAVHWGLTYFGALVALLWSRASF